MGKSITIPTKKTMYRKSMENNMLDEIWLQIAPVLLGKGKKLFEPGNYYQKFNLKSVKQMGELTELHLVK